MADLSLPYVHQFQEHLAQVRSHLSGEANDVLPSSFIAPASCWTSSEKQAFFHALARYSRLNPDLIAAHIKTKSVVDVCVYIEQLEAASRADPIPWNRTEQDIAFEVSDEWIGFEERSATALIVAEPIAHDKQRETMRQTELDKKREELGKAGTSDAFDSWRQDIEAQWGREDLLERLDTLKLKILESILRTGASVSPQPVADDDIGNTVLDPAQTDAISGSETLRNEDIARSSSPVHSVSPTADIEQPTLNTSGDDKFIGPEHPLSQEIVIPAMELEELAANDPSTEVAYEDLSPADRRRIQRRLYMRRRRAEQTGAEVNYTTARLRQGRKPTKNPARRRVGVGAKARIYHQKVLKQATGKEFSKSRIDLAVLQQNGLDLFHLSTLGQLFDFYKSGYANDEEEDIAASISADTIRLLRSIAVNFISEVMHRAIVFKHQEVHIKGDIKAWGRVQKKEISSDTIHSCLEMMGFSNLSKNKLVEQLLPCQSNPEADEGENDDSMPVHASLGILLERETPSGCCLSTFLLGLDNASTEEHRDDDPLSDTDEGFETVMKEESELDAHDKERQERYEATLWKDVT